MAVFATGWLFLPPEGILPLDGDYQTIAFKTTPKTAKRSAYQ
jgi:hypothetical protein